MMSALERIEGEAALEQATAEALQSAARVIAAEAAKALRPVTRTNRGEALIRALEELARALPAGECAPDIQEKARRFAAEEPQHEASRRLAQLRADIAQALGR